MEASEFREARNRAGLTQTQLGDQMGLSLRTIQDIESGATEVRKIHILALQALGLLDAGRQLDGRDRG